VLEAGSYRIHVQNKATSQWFELQDLHVMETMPQLIGVLCARCAMGGWVCYGRVGVLCAGVDSVV
jgi:hypothetical protein